MNINSPTICIGQTATLIASGASTYTWNTGATTGVIAVTPSTNTNYSVTGNASGCANTFSTSTLVNVLALPSVSLSAVASTVCINNKTLAITGSPSGGTLTGAGLNGNIFNPNQAGAGNYSFNYVYSDANKCSNAATLSINVSACLAINSYGNNLEIYLFPNPSNNEIKLNVPQGLLNAEFSIYDLSGRKIISEKINSLNTTINCQNFENGIYNLLITNKEKLISRKFIKG
jgi:hypothetical protein